MGGKVLVPTREFEQKLRAARLASDVLDVPTVLIARTDANSANLLTSDIDPRDHEFMTGERTAEGFYRVRNGLDQAIARGLAYASIADMLWCETSTPDLDEARRFADAIHASYPGKMLAYNCSPSFNWSAKLDAATIAKFQRELGAMGYAFQFITLAGFHSLNLGMFELSLGYRDESMSAYARVQDREFELQKGRGYSAVTHQAFVGTGYFDALANVISGGETSTAALKDSTEEHQF
jgi:isocitrate lyase